MKLSFFGADQCVTGSCHCLEINGKRILIDVDIALHPLRVRDGIEGLHHRPAGPLVFPVGVFRIGLLDVGVEINGKRILIDCGLQQGRDDIGNQDLPFEAETIDYVLVTHAHIDHTGRIPLLVRQGFTGQIWTTRLTARLMEIMRCSSTPPDGSCLHRWTPSPHSLPG